MLLDLYSCHENPHSLRGMEQYNEIVPTQILKAIKVYKKITPLQEKVLWNNPEVLVEVLEYLTVVINSNEFNVSRMSDDFVERGKRRIWDAYKSKRINEDMPKSHWFIFRNFSSDEIFKHANELFLSNYAEAILFVCRFKDSNLCLPPHLEDWQELKETLIRELSKGSVVWKPWHLLHRYFQLFLKERIPGLEPIMIKHYEHWIREEFSTRDKYTPYYADTVFEPKSLGERSMLIWQSYCALLNLEYEPEESVVKRFYPKLFS